MATMILLFSTEPTDLQQNLLPTGFQADRIVSAHERSPSPPNILNESHNQLTMPRRPLLFVIVLLPCIFSIHGAHAELREAADNEFFERRIRPILIEHCYECHSEEAQKQESGLLLDRKAGWLGGGDTGKAVVPGEPDESLLIKAVRYKNEDLQMPPEYQLEPAQVRLLEQWVFRNKGT